MTQTVTLTYQYRIKDSNPALQKALMSLSGSVNYVWNYCNGFQMEVLRRNQMGGSHTFWPSAFDLNHLTAGSGKLLGLHSQTVQAICEEYATRRKQFNKPFLRFRTNKKNRTLPWIPFKASAISFDTQSGTLTFMGLKLKTWYSRALPERAKIKTGSIVCDSTGKWFVNLTFKQTLTDEMQLNQTSAGQNLTAIDPGLNPMLTLSIEAPDGSVTYEEIEPPKYYRKSQDKLAKAQRAKKKRQARSIHKKVKNQRKDFLNKWLFALRGWKMNVEFSTHYCVILLFLTARYLKETVFDPNN